MKDQTFSTQRFTVQIILIIFADLKRFFKQNFKQKQVNAYYSTIS